MIGLVTLHPKKCRNRAVHSGEFQKCNSHREKLQDAKRGEPKNSTFSQCRKSGFSQELVMLQNFNVVYLGGAKSKEIF